MKPNVWFSFLHHCTFKTPTYGGVLSDNGNSYHALEKCEGVKTSRLNRIQCHHLFSAMDLKKNHSINIVDFITILADIDKDCFQEPYSRQILMDFGKTLLLGWNEDNNIPELYSDYIQLVYNLINSNGNSDMNLSEFISGIMKHTTFSVTDCIVLCSIFEQDGVISKARFVYILD